MIQAQDLHKHFGHKHAVDGISFTVEKGDVLGFLGPNGAGKSTTMRMITGYLQPTSGEVTIDGISVLNEPEKAKRRIGYLPESAPLYTDMPVAAFLAFCGRLRGISGSAVGDAVERVIDLCFLGKVRHQSIDTLSKGYRHRTCLAQSLIHDPEVLILDEPTDGLDPNQKHEIRSLIREMGKTKAIIFSTHILEEVEAACTRAVIIDQGAIVADGTPAELKARAPHAGHIRFTVLGTGAQDAISAVQGLSACGGLEIIESGSESLTALAKPARKTNPADLAAAIYQEASSKSWNLGSLTEEAGRLDEVFRTITSKETDGAEAAPSSEDEEAAA